MRDTTALPKTLEAAQQRIQELEKRCVQERCRREKAENNERCFRELAEHIREVFWMTNSAGDELVYISPAYEQIWGQTCESLYSDPGQRLAWVHDGDRERVLIAFKRDATLGRYDQTYRINRPDGGIRWIRDRAFPVTGCDGELYRLAGFALDITDLVKANDELHTLHDQITSHERLGVFAALGTGLAHDLSQPLTAAQTFIASARNQTGSDASGHAVEAALAQADGELCRATAIIKHLRDFAREGKATPTTQPLAPVLKHVHRLLEPALRRNQIHLDTPSEEELAEINVPIDDVFVRLILRNLIVNAIDAFDGNADRPRQIGIEIEHSLSGHTDIAVTDNGCGFDDTFDPFATFATAKASGLGLGLPICRSLARSQGGDLFIAERGGNERDGTGRTRVIIRLASSA